MENVDANMIRRLLDMEWEIESSIIPRLNSHGLLEEFPPPEDFDHEIPYELFENGNENDKRVWRNVLDCLFDPNEKTIASHDDGTMINKEEIKQETVKDKNKGVTRESVFKHFHLPLKEAAKELNVGETLLKRRCRDFGIKRWPHRKMMSLQTLINNVKSQELKLEKESKGKKEDEIRRLEKEKKLLEKMPNVKLDPKTMKLRQAGYKAKHKRKQMSNM